MAAPERVLETGTAHGVGTAYIAAALEVNGGGSIVTLDHSSAPYCDPTPDELLAVLGLRHRVELCRDPSSSYTWWLRALIKERSDAHGNCEPLYNFIYLPRRRAQLDYRRLGGRALRAAAQTWRMAASR